MHDPALVPLAFAQALGVRDTGDLPLLGKLETALRDRSILLVIDNFERGNPETEIGAAVGTGAGTVIRA